MYVNIDAATFTLLPAFKGCSPLPSYCSIVSPGSIHGATAYRANLQDGRRSETAGDMSVRISVACGKKDFHPSEHIQWLLDFGNVPDVNAEKDSNIDQEIHIFQAFATKQISSLANGSPTMAP